MVDTISLDRMSLSSSSHHRNNGQVNRQFSSYHHPNTANSSNSGMNGSCHGNRNSGGLNGSSHHARGTSQRNKSFNKPRVSPSNPVYDPLSSNSNHSSRSTGSFLHSYKKPDLPQKGQYIAMDCEMVGTVTGESVAARVVLIDWRGRVVLDTYMKPEVEVADYRTFVSGITEENLREAPHFNEVINQVKELLQEKILVGHGVDNDLRALGIVHPWLMTRDTAYYQPFMRLLDVSSHQTRNGDASASSDPVWGPRKLKELAKEKLQREIQVAGISHCPVEDAAAALDLYKSHRPRWEACMSSEERQQQQYSMQMAAARAYESLMMSQECTQTESPIFTSVLAPPTRPKSMSSNMDLSMSMHSYFRYGEPQASYQSSTIRPLAIPSMLNTGLSLSFHQQGLLEGHSYHGRMDSSLDSGSFHGTGKTTNRKQFHRSSSLSEAPINHTAQRPSSLKYAPPGIQRQRSFDHEFLGTSSPQGFDFRPDLKENMPYVETTLFQGCPPPGFDGF